MRTICKYCYLAAIYYGKEEKKAHFEILINHHFICYGEKLRRLMNAQSDFKQKIFHLLCIPNTMITPVNIEMMVTKVYRKIDSKYNFCFHHCCFDVAVFTSIKRIRFLWLTNAAVWYFEKFSNIFTHNSFSQVMRSTMLNVSRTETRVTNSITIYNGKWNNDFNLEKSNKGGDWYLLSIIELVLWNWNQTPK